MNDASGEPKHQDADGWEARIARLAHAYRDAEKGLLGLPLASLRPFATFLWSALKLAVFAVIDVLLLLPFNLLVVLRNLFPGRWVHRSLSWPYLRFLALWFWRGEFFTPTLFLRPLTQALLVAHVRRRLQLLKRAILLQNDLSDGRRQALLEQVDGLLAVWPAPGFATVLLTYVIPAVGPVLELWRRFTSAGLPGWVEASVLASLWYSLAVLATAFAAKRGLLLGARGRDALLPGAADGSGTYGIESEVFGGLGVRVREIPLDILIWMLGNITFFAFTTNIAQNYLDLGLIGPEQVAGMRRNSAIEIGAYVPILTLAWMRRTRLGRM